MFLVKTVALLLVGLVVLACVRDDLIRHRKTQASHRRKRTRRNWDGKWRDVEDNGDNF